MLVAAGHAQLKGKLQDKSRWRPTAMVMKKMPDGTGDLAELLPREFLLKLPVVIEILLSHLWSRLRVQLAS